MTQFEKMTIPVSKAIVATIFICSNLIIGLTAYFSSKNGVRDGFDKVNNRLSDLENKYNAKIQALEINEDYLKRDLADIKGIVMTYREAIKPNTLQPEDKKAERMN